MNGKTIVLDPKTRKPSWLLRELIYNFLAKFIVRSSLKIDMTFSDHPPVGKKENERVLNELKILIQELEYIYENFRKEN